MAAKYKLARQTLWVATKVGDFTGYGATPKLAFANAEARKKAKRANTAAIQQALMERASVLGTCDQLKQQLETALGDANKHSFNVTTLRSERARLQASLKALSDVTEGASKTRADEQRAAKRREYVLVSMVCTGKSDPDAAANVFPCEAEALVYRKAAVQEVRVLIDRWKEYNAAVCPARRN